MLPLKQRFRDSQIVIITNFVILSSVGIQRIVCTENSKHIAYTFLLSLFRVNSTSHFMRIIWLADDWHELQAWLSLEKNKKKKKKKKKKKRKEN